MTNHANTSGSSEGGCPVDHKSMQKAPEGCPVDHSDAKYNSKANDMEFNQQPAPGQKTHLKVDRQQSTILKGEFTPKHQPESGEKWVYPSEQQYYNAMRRKGYNPDEKDIPTILAIHNSVNEQGWLKVKEWEALRGNTNPKLVRFMGRPNATSPKAWFKYWVLSYSMPFDRHDWIVERNGKEVRYVIDFYKGKASEMHGGSRVGMHLDVRPALDSVGALVDVISYEFRLRFRPHSLPRNSLISHSTFSSMFPSSKK